MASYANPIGRVRRRAAVVASAVTVAAGGLLVGIIPTSAAAASEVKFGYVGAEYQEFTIPEGAGSELRVTARGGGGGAGYYFTSEGSVGAEASGVLDVRPGDVIRFAVAGTGQQWREDNNQSKGGWGGLNATGGDGALIGDTSGAGGGGATTVELVRDGQPTTVMVAGGGGGFGAPYLNGLDIAGSGEGGHGGDNAEGRSARGSDGRPGYLNPLPGGSAGSQAAGAGQAAKVQSGETSGGGGGGGVKGGAHGSNASAGKSAGGSGGGAGSTVIDDSLKEPSIFPADKSFRAKNGEFKYAWV